MSPPPCDDKISSNTSRVVDGTGEVRAHHPPANQDGLRANRSKPKLPLAGDNEQSETEQVSDSEIHVFF